MTASMRRRIFGTEDMYKPVVVRTVPPPTTFKLGRIAVITVDKNWKPLIRKEGK